MRYVVFAMALAALVTACVADVAVVASRRQWELEAAGLDREISRRSGMMGQHMQAERRTRRLEIQAAYQAASAESALAVGAAIEADKRREEFGREVSARLGAIEARLRSLEDRLGDVPPPAPPKNDGPVRPSPQNAG